MKLRELVLAVVAVLVLMSGQALAQEKIALSTDDSFDVLAHKMVDFGIGLGGYSACNPETDQTRNKQILEYVDSWLANNQPVNKANVLTRIFQQCSFAVLDEATNLISIGNETQYKVLCEKYMVIYGRLVIPGS